MGYLQENIQTFEKIWYGEYSRDEAMSETYLKNIEALRTQYT